MSQCSICLGLPLTVYVNVRGYIDACFHAFLEQDMGEAEIDFPFRVSPSEQAIIENDPDPPCSIVLVGRSGTGKTTCAVFRMWARWLAFRHHSTEPFNQVSLLCSSWLRCSLASTVISSF